MSATHQPPYPALSPFLVIPPLDNSFGAMLIGTFIGLTYVCGTLSGLLLIKQLHRFRLYGMVVLQSYRYFRLYPEDCIRTKLVVSILFHPKREGGYSYRMYQVSSVLWVPYPPCQHRS